MRVVLVNGLPGAGKTTLARALAPLLALPLFSKDAVKESIADQLTAPPGLSPRDWSRQLGAAASEALWTLLATAGPGAVLESPWIGPNARFVVAGLRRAGVDPAGVHEVFCDLPADLARQRFIARGRTAERHPIHTERGTGDHSAETWAAWIRDAAPLGLGPVHRVDTTAPVDVAALAARIRAT